MKWKEQGAITESAMVMGFKTLINRNPLPGGWSCE
jgi:hypothetical protein